MKETIEYYYNIYINSLMDEDGIYTFNIGDDHYYFVYTRRNSNDLSSLNEVIKNLKQKNLFLNEIVPNINNSYITNVNDSNYILMKVYKPKTKIFLPEIIDFNRKTRLINTDSPLSRLKWNTLWQTKIDYIEQQLNELYVDKIIINSVDFYIGLTENAIYYYNVVINKYQQSQNDVISVCHQRIGYPNYKLNFYNPLSFIFDYSVRDIAEYLKSMFYMDEDALSELKSYLSINKLSVLSANLLYARLLYPSYYFDEYEKIVNDKKSSTILIKIISKNKEYLQFLQDAYKEINQYYPLEIINWIIY